MALKERPKRQRAKTLNAEAKNQVKEFLQLFLPITVLLVIGTWSLGNSRINAEMAILKVDEKSYVELALSRLDQELAVPIRHITSLVRETPVRETYQAAGEPNLVPMQEAFISMMARNPSYDKIIWIDERGMERVRVNSKQGQPYLVPKAQLQDKGDRYFFTDTMKLHSGVIYISPLDLNVDNGQIETPYKPTLRVSTHVFDASNHDRGILIINVLARSMLNAFTSAAGPAADRMMLLNAKGYWLKSRDEADEWGFMFDRPTTLANRNPDAWQAISASEKGQVLLNDGLWTWTTGSPAPERDSRLSHNIRWKVVAHLDKSVFSALAGEVWPTKIVSTCVVLLLFGIGIVRLIQAKTARLKAETAAALAHREVEAVHKLQEAQTRFKMLFEASTNGLLVVDDCGRIVTVNLTFENMFGYRLGDLLDRAMDILLPESVRERHIEDIRGYLRQPGNRVMNVGDDLYGTRKDGSVFPIEIGLSHYRENNQTFVLATIVDISERKRAQDEIVHMNEVLEQRVAERTEELQASRTEAERLASVKGNFLANMSHEIRTPLNAILGLAYLLEQSPLGQEELNLVKRIRIAGRSLLGIINDILDFSKIESGRLEIEQVPFCLNDLLENVAALTSAVEHKPEVELIIGAASPDIKFLRGDSLRLEQILVNLISNALKFTDRGSVVLAVQKTGVASGHGAARIRFSVTDTGKGIAPDKQEEIFTPFAQEDTSTTRRFGGTGLGLSICHSLVKMMGGELGVISELSRGSEFWFELPMETVEPKNYACQDVVFQNVLIADDHPIALEALVAAARSLGWNPEAVDSGDEAVAHLISRAQNNKLPDLILLDWRMPGMDGIAAGKAIKNYLGDIADVPIIVMTSAFDRDQFMQCPDAGIADAILNKPATASSLYNAVCEAKRGRCGAASRPVKEKTEGGRLSQLRVLVVDDSEINREVAKRILEMEGASVYLADDGQTALSWLSYHSNQVDIVLMDIQMPLMDGYEATRQIRSTLGISTLPIIALTAGAFKNQQAAAFAAGMNGFIAKPFDVDDLITQMERYSINRSREVVAASPRAITEPLRHR